MNPLSKIAIAAAAMLLMSCATSRVHDVRSSGEGDSTAAWTLLDADNDGQEVTPAVKARGDGVYRLSIAQGANVLADVAVTRACARRAR